MISAVNTCRALKDKQFFIRPSAQLRLVEVLDVSTDECVLTEPPNLYRDEPVYQKVGRNIAIRLVDYISQSDVFEILVACSSVGSTMAYSVIRVCL